MTRLLVSVRSAAEAIVAADAGADLIDVKEPDRGSLGPADPLVVQQVCGALGSSRPISAALGELLELERSGQVPSPSPGVLFAKLGLAGCADLSDWPARWQRAVTACAPGVQPVAVVYADSEAAHSPSLDDVLIHAQTMGCPALLIDTFDKRGPGLVRLWASDELQAAVFAAHRADMICVLAGQLTLEQVPGLLRFDPDYIAVRGAVCTGGRTGILSAELVQQLQLLLHRQG